MALRVNYQELLSQHCQPILIWMSPILMYVDFRIPYSSLAVVNKMSHDDCKFPEATLVKTVNHLTQKFGGDDVTCQ